MADRERVRRIPPLAALVSLFLLSACAHLSSERLYAPQKAYLADGGPSAAARYAPLLVVEGFAHPYNRIGTPRARETDNGRERIYVDPSQATLYTEEIKFKTASGEYTNLLYRFHFVI